MSRKEARIARKLKRRADQEAKSARLKAEPIEKQVRTGANPGSIFQMQMRWTIDAADREGAWSWGVNREWGEEVWNSSLLPKLEEYQKLTWAEIEAQAYGNEGKRHRANHSMETAQICDEAQIRLTNIGQYSDTVFRFRLGNLPRLWGVRVVENFKVLWYDPSHQIYPVD